MDFLDLIVAVHRQLDDGALPHAFGGALALGYVAEPRGTVDIDVNVFVPVADLPRIAEALAPLELRPPTDPDLTPVAGIRFTHDTEPFPVDVFPSLDERYDEVRRRVVWHPFVDDNLLPFLSAEDLCVFKLSFGRPQDWVDLANIARSILSLDLDYVEEQLIGLRGPTMYQRLARFRGYLDAT